LTEANATQSTEPTYYIQDTRSYVGNSVLWWRENGQGYTTDFDDAGVYSEAESARICKNRATEKRIPVNVARAAIVRSVKAGKLFEEMAKQTEGS
jgi:ABC-type branched-subunit amino acid transport system ATPase component